MSAPTITIDPTPELARRLFPKVRPMASGCWEWTGYRERFGHGVTTIPGSSRAVKAHRASYVLLRGPIPDGMFVCHKCDNPPCCNPAHLFLGTAADNNRDMRTKGRLVPPPLKSGSDVNGAKLTEAQVAEIRRRFVGLGKGRAAPPGHSSADLAAKFGTTARNVRRIAAGDRWAS